MAYLFPANMDPYQIMMGLILLLTPFICWVFTLHDTSMRTPFKKWLQVIHDQRFYFHAMGYIVIIRWKALTDKLNEPIKNQTGHWTETVYALEGELTFQIQQFFHPFSKTFPPPTIRYDNANLV